MRHRGRGSGGQEQIISYSYRDQSLSWLCQKTHRLGKKTLLIKTFLYKSESNCAGWLNSFSEVRKAIDVPKLLARVKKLHRLGWDVRLSKHGPIKKVNSLKLAGLVDGPARWLIYLIFISPHLPIVFFFSFLRATLCPCSCQKWIKNAVPFSNLLCALINIQSVQTCKIT